MLFADTGVLVAAPDLDDRDHHLCAALLGTYTYTYIGLDVADVSIIAVAERLEQTVIATLDERDFRIVRRAHTNAFDLLPGPS